MPGIRYSETATGEGLEWAANYCGPKARTKSIDKLVAEAKDPLHRLRKPLGPRSLTALGLGAVIGAGIFVLSGTGAASKTLQVESLLHTPLLAPLLSVILHGSEAAGMSERPGASPAIVLFFLLAAIACGLTALCYAELASLDSRCRQRLHIRLCHARHLRLIVHIGGGCNDRHC